MTMLDAAIGGKKPTTPADSLTRIGDALGVTKRLDSKTLARVRDAQNKISGLWTVVDEHSRVGAKRTAIGQARAVAQTELSPDEVRPTLAIREDFTAVRAVTKESIRELGRASREDCVALAKTFADVAEAEALRIDEADAAIHKRFGIVSTPCEVVRALREAGSTAVLLASRDGGQEPKHRLPWLAW